MNENFTIEDARPEDVETIRLIARDAWLELYPNEEYGITREDIAAIDWLNPEKIEKRKKKLENKNHHTWVVKHEQEKVVGFCQVSIEEGREIEAMYVRPEFQKKGLGRKLMEKAFEWLGADEDIRLEVASYNKNAIDFYKNFGFKETSLPVSVDKRTQLPSGRKIPRIVMVRAK